jgi:hypothetical protein
MPESKNYLNVSFAQKDETKTLGARWDAVKKKWYVLTNKDITFLPDGKLNPVLYDRQERRPHLPKSVPPRRPPLVLKPMQLLLILLLIMVMYHHGIRVYC